LNNLADTLLDLGQVEKALPLAAEAVRYAKGGGEVEAVALLTLARAHAAANP
jgi:hypothetical protein